MFFSNKQIKKSIERLHTLHSFFGTAFLAFKKAEIPIGSTKQVTFTRIVDEIMYQYYKPISSYKGFYSPFKTSNPQNRWNDERYSSTTAQRIATDTFSNALIHPKGSQMWGWKENYIEVLLKEHLNGDLVPVFDLAVWIFQDRDWYDGITKESIIELFFIEFKIRTEERILFDRSIENASVDEWLQINRVSINDLLDIIGDPPDIPLEESAILDSLKMTFVGPVDSLDFNPAPRLNLVTGDNGLGKTFLLECTWWALTGSWAGEPAYPRKSPEKTSPTIGFTIRSSRRTSKSQGKYNREQNMWVISKRGAVPGLSIFARSDGSFTIWDPARKGLLGNTGIQTDGLDAQMSLSRSDVLYGKDDVYRGRRISICRGLLRDWIDWQYRSNSDKRFFDLFRNCIRIISPHRREILEPGDSIKLPPDFQDIPSLRFPYGDVPFIHCSAGIQRIVCLVYMVMWAWTEHVRASENIGKDPERSIILLVDEMEAHLHPFWQRTVVPALMNVVQHLNRQVQIQAIIATHSPLILASVEGIFREDIDDLFHLDLDEDGQVKFVNMKFVKRGGVNEWLTSDVFGLREPRALEAEKAITFAEELQQDPKASKDQIQEATNLLLKALGPDDAFWIRWIYYARKNGVDI